MSPFKLFGHSPAGPADSRVKSMALVCEAFLSFDSDKALHGFAEQLLHAKSPDAELQQAAQIEAAMGFHGSDVEAKAILKDLLQKSAQKTGLRTGTYRPEFFMVHSQVPPARVWCLVAMPA